jgi:AcrR family transcriptional regulator
MSDYHHGNLKQRLLDQGLKLLNEEGYASFSLRKLARRCRVSHNSPYRHFKDKDELIATLAREIHNKFNRALRDSIGDGEATREEKLRAMGRGYINFFLDHPDYLELLFLTPEIQKLADADCPGDSPFRTYLSTVTPLLSDPNTDPGDMPAEPLGSELDGALLQPWCTVHGLTVLLVKRALPVESAEARERLIDQVLNGYMTNFKTDIPKSG